jgi:hypothetical protein
MSKHNNNMPKYDYSDYQKSWSYIYWVLTLCYFLSALYKWSHLIIKQVSAMDLELIPFFQMKKYKKEQ